MAHANTSWRSSYLLGVALLLPIGTLVLVSYYFARMSPLAGGGFRPDHWAFSVIAIAGGLSAVMAALLALFAFATYRARVRFEHEYRNLSRYLNEDVARERVKLQRNLDLVSAAQQVSLAVKQETDFERIIAVVLEQLEFFARSETVAVFVLDKQERPVARALRRKGVNRFAPDLSAEDVECTLVEEAVRRGQLVRKVDEENGLYTLAVFFSTPEGVRGAVRISRNLADDPEFLDELVSYEQAVAQLVRMVGLGLKATTMWDRAIKDEKTGLYNHNHYADQMRRRVAVARRSGVPLSLVMLDIDKFKHINDRYGHLAGDLVLSQVSALLIREARETDTPYRYGGEEMCVICNGTTEHDAAQFAERLRQVIAHTEFRDDKGRLLPISASFGIAEFDAKNMADEKALKQACDEALYKAKEGGRNCVVIAEGNGRFMQVERAGDLQTEVKRRLGLAGDNSPLARDSALHAAAEQPVANLVGENIDALASGLAEVVGDKGDHTRIVDSLVREATQYLAQNLSERLMQARNKSLRRSGKLAPVPADADTSAKKATRRKRAPRKRKDTIVLTPEEAALRQESDRLDYLTPQEGEQLIAGQPPSKRLRPAG